MDPCSTSQLTLLVAATHSLSSKRLTNRRSLSLSEGVYPGLSWKFWNCSKAPGKKGINFIGKTSTLPQRPPGGPTEQLKQKNDRNKRKSNVAKEVRQAASHIAISRTSQISVQHPSGRAAVTFLAQMTRRHSPYAE